MKRGQIVLFILAVMAALACICAVFPKDGVNVLGFQLNFPTLRDVLSSDEEPEEDTALADSLRLAEEAARASERDAFAFYMENSPTRFVLPEGDTTFFDSFFADLENASAKPVRIIHYGDSQLEEDRITAQIREKLQDRFGGSGPGLLPLRHYFTPRTGIGTSRELRRYMAYGDASFRCGSDKYGPFADFVRMDTAVTVSIIPVKSKSSTPHMFSKATILAGNLRSDVTVSGADTSITVAPGEAMNLISLDLPDSTSSFRFSLSGHADFYGVLLDADSGVSVDNVAMRGCSGELFTSINQEQLRDFYRKAGVRMILLQYGGNSVPYLTSGKAISTYKASIERQIKRIHELAPGAKIVFVGPSDMATSINGKRQTYPMLPAVVDSLKSAATSNGAAYWSIYDAMGGKGSMVSWVNASPALAGPDYIHFTPKGAVKMGNMFADALLYYYDYYLWRKKNE